MEEDIRISGALHTSISGALHTSISRALHTSISGDFEDNHDDKQNEEPPNTVHQVMKVHELLGSFVGNINELLAPTIEQKKVEQVVRDDGCVVGDKRVLHVDDTWHWGIGIHVRYTTFLKHASEQVLTTSSQHVFLNLTHLSDLLQRQIQKSDLGRAWTGAIGLSSFMPVATTG